MLNLVNPYLYKVVGGAPFIVSIGTETVALSTGTITATLPPTFASGDLLIVLYGTAGGYAAADTPTSSGYSLVGTSGRINNTGGSYGWAGIFQKTATGSESNPTFTSTYTGNGNLSIIMFAVRNWSSVGNFSGFSTTSTAVVSMDSPSVTTVGNNALVIYTAVNRNRNYNTTSFDPPEISTTNTPRLGMTKTVQAVAGATPTCTWTPSGATLVDPLVTHL